jgi:hypothetical protein
VKDTFIFNPPRKTGTIFHLVAIAILTIAVAVSLFRIAYAEVGSTFLTHLIPILLAIPIVPLLVYRLNALQNAVYRMERDSIRLQWGLRVEVIPTTTILWVQASNTLAEPIRYPWIRWPGSVLGTRHLGGKTPIEFMASTTKDLVLVATYERVFAISPADPDTFIHSYQRLTELGSLIPPAAQSVRPTTILTGIWQTPSSRYLISASLLLGLGLIVWSSLAAPSKNLVSLGFLPTGEPREPIPGVRLMLLPLLNTMFWVFNFFTGLILSRSKSRRPLAYLLWGNSVFIAGLFLVAVYFILRID